MPKYSDNDNNAAYEDTSANKKTGITDKGSMSDFDFKEDDFDDFDHFEYSEDDYIGDDDIMTKTQTTAKTKSRPAKTVKKNTAKTKINDTKKKPQKIAKKKNGASGNTNAASKTRDDVARRIRQKKKARRKNKYSLKGLRRFVKRSKKPLLAAAAVLFSICIAFFIFCLSAIDGERVMNNVYIENLNVGGLTYNEALDAVNATYLFEESEITITDGVSTYAINGNEIGLAALPQETAQKAFDYGKSGNIFYKAFTAAKLLFKKHVVVPAPQLDTARLDEKLNECGNIMAGERKQHYVSLDEGSEAVVYPGQTGYNGDPSGAREQIIESLSNEMFRNIRVSFTSEPPDELTVEELDLIIYKDPVNASYKIENNELVIIPGANGRYIDKEEAAALLAGVHEGGEPVRIPYYESEPEVTEASLSSMILADTLSSFQTSFEGSTENRCANVRRAAKLIDGSVVMPGEVFSFNNTVGKRTKENGFFTAKEYINGASVDGIGGGTCQVSSTLYAAVLYADMSIVERLNHVMSVGYIDLGMDATVADAGIDFKFRNTSSYPIQISAKTSGTTITVSILGTAWDPPREVKIEHKTSSPDQYTYVYSTRYVYSNGELISTDKLNSSTYIPHYSYSSDDDYDSYN